MVKGKETKELEAGKLKGYSPSWEKAEVKAYRFKPFTKFSRVESAQAEI